MGVNFQLCIVRLKAHPSVPNASLPNLNDFSNADVTGLVKKSPDVRSEINLSLTKFGVYWL